MQEMSYDLQELLSILEYYKNKNIEMLALEVDNKFGRLKVIPLSNKGTGLKTFMIINC